MQKVAKERLTEYSKSDIMKEYTKTQLRVVAPPTTNLDDVETLHKLIKKREDILFGELGVKMAKAGGYIGHWAEMSWMTKKAKRRKIAPESS